MTATRGSLVVEALVAIALAGGALALLAQGGRTAGSSARTVTQVAAALDVAAERLDALRAWPAPDGSDFVHPANRPECRRSWSSTGGRGLPRSLVVTVTSGRHHIVLASEAFP